MDPSPDGSALRRFLRGARPNPAPAPAPPTALYRATPAARADTPGSFWATDAAYPHYVNPGAPLYAATLRPDARTRRYDGSPSKRRLAAARRAGVQAAVFACWDWPGDEVVVLDPAALADVRPLAAPPAAGGGV